MKFIIKVIFIIGILVTCSPVFTQEVPAPEPKIGRTYDFSKERQEQWALCDSLMISKTFKEKLTQEERHILWDKCGGIYYSESCESSWSIICGNDWTEEGYPYPRNRSKPNYEFTEVSSATKPYKNITYDEKNICDLSYKTAWIEGVKGYGISESVTFNFQAGHPRINKVIIANGYIKSKTTWKNNSRVKQLKMYLNNKPFAILNLKDVYANQTFDIPIIGYTARMDMKGYHHSSDEVLDKDDKELKINRIRFEILKVYKGDKYKDTAITEIYFDGLDVR